MYYRTTTVESKKIKLTVTTGSCIGSNTGNKRSVSVYQPHNSKPL